MNLIDARTIPADPIAAERVAAAGLDYRVVDVSDVAAGGAFARADARGFLDADPEDDQREQLRASWVDRRNIGVYEQGSASDALPVATVNSWVAPMTAPGGEIPMWAISSVTVAATHRRRGIARNLLEGELRAAAAAGVPIAGLTASEATIYPRYGFAAAVPVARMRIDARRAGWTGGDAPGRLAYVEREQLARELGEVHERSRARRAGQIPGWAGRWRRMAGLTPGASKAAAVRGVHYLDAAGAVRGVVAYAMEEVPDRFGFTCSVHHLAAETDEALRALWGFLVQHDLVETITVDLRPVDDPIPQLVVDQRAVEVAVHDHGWLRVLDVPAVLAARAYRAPLDAVLRVADPYGFADGTWRLRVDGTGAAEIEPSDAVPDVELGVVELSALSVGGVRATQLRAAGRIRAEAAVAASFDDAFRTADAPLLGIWY